MELKGKFLCGIAGMFICDLIGLPFGGLIGFVLGSVAGHYIFDQPKEKTAENAEYDAYQRRKGTFLYHVFTLCAKIAKVDGAINRQEIAHMEHLMRNQFRMSDRGRGSAIKIWKQAKESNEPFEVYARAFYNDFSAERHHVNDMMDILFSMAAADGGLHPHEEDILLRAAGTFHVGRLQYERIKARYFHVPPSQQQRWTPLDPYYAILGVKPTETLDGIKKKFRALAMEWHPDRLTAQGASAERLRHGKEKFQQINDAYEKIVDARKN